MKKAALSLAFLALVAGALGAARVRAAGRNEPVTKPLALAATQNSRDRVVAEGRIATYPGKEVIVATDFAGTIERLLVAEKSAVKKGDLLAEMDASQEKASLDEARARVTEAEADIRLAQYESERAEKLVATKVGTQQALDKARRDVDAARARKATAESAVKRLEALVKKARITAPIDGVILTRHADAGETLERGKAIVTVADLSRLRIEAEVDEYDTARIALGAKVLVRAEGLEGVVAEGTVEEIPDSVTLRRTKPQDPAKPGDTRVLLVKVALSDPNPALKLGRRVEVEIGR